MDVERVSRRELDSSEVIDKLDQGGRIVVELELFGRSKDVVLRKSQKTYHCDTGLKLFSYDDPDEMRACVERLRLAAPE